MASRKQRFSIIAAVFAALFVALPAVAQETPHGACVMKAVRQEVADRKACNEKHGNTGTTGTPERSACFKKVDADRRAANAACKSLSKDHPKK